MCLFTCVPYCIYNTIHRQYRFELIILISVDLVIKPRNKFNVHCLGLEPINIKIYICEPMPWGLNVLEIKCLGDNMSWGLTFSAFWRFQFIVKYIIGTDYSGTYWPGLILYEGSKGDLGLNECIHKIVCHIF